jgi:hypothetical protein
MKNHYKKKKNFESICIKGLGIKVISKYASAFGTSVAMHSHACHVTDSTGVFMPVHKTVKRVY